jgi:uracil-DNA glycosylase family 4
VPAALPKAKKAGAVAVEPAGAPIAGNAVDIATKAASGAGDLEQLRSAMAGFDLCDLKKGARNLVFSDGDPNARIMIIGEAPGREEDMQGRPFAGPAGQLLDKMLAAIGLARDAIYITNVLPWRPPQNRDPEPAEIEMMLPFVKRHIELAAPEVIVLMGNAACQALLGRKGITRMRGNWETHGEIPVLPMFHPDNLLRNPAAKREAWHDLLVLQARLRAGESAG